LAYMLQISLWRLARTAPGRQATTPSALLRAGGV
jgi:hypothetical protein